MAKMGRPKSDNPKLHRFSVRVTDAEYEDILNYSELRLCSSEEGTISGE